MSEDEKVEIAARKALDVIVYREHTNYRLDCLRRRIPATEEGFEAWVMNDMAANPDKYNFAVVDAAVQAVVAEEVAAGRVTYDPETGLIGRATGAPS